MSIKLVIDMNLSPDWIPVLNDHGWQAIHWSAVGDPRASDRTIMEWAVKHEHVVFTHDLDFGTSARCSPCLTRPDRAFFRFVGRMFCRTIWMMWSLPP